MMKALILIFSFLSTAVQAAQLPKADWELKAGKLTYHVNFPLKKALGVSEAAKGKGRCEKDACQFLIAVPVKSFSSGDGNRDNHMLEVTRAGDHPMVIVKVKIPKDVPASGLKANAEVNFAGKTHVYDNLAIATEFKDKSATTKGTIPLKLSEYSVERPSLLGVSIDDDVPVDFDLTWN